MFPRSEPASNRKYSRRYGVHSFIRVTFWGDRSDMNGNDLSKILVIDANDVARLLTINDCVDLMAKTLADLAYGIFHQPLRMIVRPSDAKGLLGLMPAYRASDPALYGLK